MGSEQAVRGAARLRLAVRARLAPPVLRNPLGSARLCHLAESVSAASWQRAVAESALSEPGKMALLAGPARAGCGKVRVRPTALTRLRCLGATRFLD